MSELIESPTITMPNGVPFRVRWNVEQYENLSTMGLMPSEGYELIEGDIVEKMSTHYHHGFVQTTLMFVLAQIFGHQHLMLPVSLWIDDYNLPEPDIAVMLQAARSYLAGRHLRPADLRAVIEVSDATLATDLTVKARLYARAQIAEYWVVDVAGRRLLVHRMPGENGYDAVTQYVENDAIPTRDGGESTVLVSEILP